MNQFAFSFRDYAVYLFPGLVYIAGIIILSETLKDFLVTQPIVASFIFLLGGYLAGVFGEALLYRLIWRDIIRKVSFWKDPIKDIFDSPKESSLTYLALSLLREHLGKETVEAESATALTYFCLRYIEIKSPEAAQTPDRINSLLNLTANLVPALLVLCIALFLSGLWIFACVALACAFSLPFKNRSYRFWLVRTVLRQYVILRLDSKDPAAPVT